MKVEVNFVNKPNIELLAEALIELTERTFKNKPPKEEKVNNKT